MASMPGHMYAWLCRNTVFIVTRPRHIDAQLSPNGSWCSLQYSKIMMIFAERCREPPEQMCGGPTAPAPATAHPTEQLAGQTTSRVHAQTLRPACVYMHKRSQTDPLSDVDPPKERMCSSQRFVAGGTAGMRTRTYLDDIFETKLQITAKVFPLCLSGTERPTGLAAHGAPYRVRISGTTDKMKSRACRRQGALLAEACHRHST
jgi:hypothetical protein